MADPLASVPLSALRVFEAAARLKSFTRAGGELGMTQAAVSWQVKALERRLDLALFRRLPREVELTPAGERLARAATEAVGVLRTALTDLTETEQGVLNVTTLHTFATQWLAPRLGAFQLSHPKIAVRMDTSPTVFDLGRDRFDVGIRTGHGVWPGLEAVRLFPTIETPLCTPEIRNRYNLRTPADLKNAPLIGNDADWGVWFAAAGLADAPPERPMGLMGDTQMVEMALGLGGQGVALGSPIYFAAEIAAGRLVQPFEPVAIIGNGIWLCYSEERRRSPKIRAFRDWILETLQADEAVQRFKHL